MESLESQVLWTYCDRQDDRLANESIYDQKKGAALLKQRKVNAEEHESVRLAGDMGGQVLDVLPR